MKIEAKATSLENTVSKIGPSSKKQEDFLNSTADITLYGGAAGSGKSYCGLMDLLKWVHLPKFRGVCFRRTTPQLKGSGGLWDTALGMYSDITKIKTSTKDNKIVFPSGAEIKMMHCEHDKDRYNIQGWQISEALVDEATQFTETQVMYIISRLRTDAEMKSHLKMTANPDADSFLRKWLDKAGYLSKDGYPLEENSGNLVYCGQIGGEMVFEQTLEDWKEKYPNSNPMTFTFIPATCRDNPVLLEQEPDYLTKLENLPRIERARLLEGNWHVREESAGYFKREWCGDPLSLYQIPRFGRQARSWDKAATLPSEVYPDPDFTVGIKGTIDESGVVYVLDMVRFRDRPAKVQQRIEEVGISDGEDCVVTIPRDAGAAGKTEADNCSGKIFSLGLTCKQKQTSKSKEKRFEPVSALAENGMLKICKGDWNEIFFDELEQFGSGRGHDDVVDALADLVHELCMRKAIPNFTCPSGLGQMNAFNIKQKAM